MPRVPATDPVLALDTSTERLAVGLYARGLLHTRDLPGSAAASAALLPAVGELLQAAGCTLHDLAAVAFGQGPGAFTGLRTSCAVAQGLAFGLGCPVLPLDSLQVVAEQLRHVLPLEAGATVGVLMDARMGEAYAGRYRWSGRGWQLLRAPALWSPAALAEDWAADPPQHGAGTGLALFDGLLRHSCPQLQRVAVGDDRALALLALALRAWAAGGGVDAADALPLYLRDKVALTTAERAAQRAGQPA